MSRAQTLRYLTPLATSTALSNAGTMFYFRQTLSAAVSTLIRLRFAFDSVRLQVNLDSAPVRL